MARRTLSWIRSLVGGVAALTALLGCAATTTVTDESAAGAALEQSAPVIVASDGDAQIESADGSGDEVSSMTVERSELGDEPGENTGLAEAADVAEVTDGIVAWFGDAVAERSDAFLVTVDGREIEAAVRPSYDADQRELQLSGEVAPDAASGSQIEQAELALWAVVLERRIPVRFAGILEGQLEEIAVPASEMQRVQVQRVRLRSSQFEVVCPIDETDVCLDSLRGAR